MKKQTILTVLATIVVVSLFAQSSAVHDFASQGWALALAHWPVLAKVAAVMAIVSEVLALIPSDKLAANGVLDAIVKLIKSVFGKK